MKYDILTQKKKTLDACRPFPKELVNNLEEWFRIELTYTSNAIEGNTLTRRETALVVEKGLTVGGKSLVEHLEATNHAQALDWVKDKVTHKPQNLTEKDILALHTMILKGIDDESAGSYRRVPVRISGSSVILPNPLKVTSLMEDFMEWIQKAPALHRVEFAAECHYRLVTIHPFIDGNGRTARLLMNLILLMSGYPAALIRKRDRLAYITSLETAQLGGSKEGYYKIISKAVERSLNIYIKALEGKKSDPVENKPLLKIGQLAKRSGESTATIRHWIEENLLDIADKMPSGYFLFEEAMVERIVKIRHFQSQRLTLKEIKEKINQ